MTMRAHNVPAAAYIRSRLRTRRIQVDRVIASLRGAVDSSSSEEKVYSMCARASTINAGWERGSDAEDWATEFSRSFRFMLAPPEEE